MKITTLLLFVYTPFIEGFFTRTNRISSYRILHSELALSKVDEIAVDGELVALSNNILVKVREAPVSSFGGVIIPEKFKERPNDGTVINIGSGKIHPETGYHIPFSVDVNDCVLYGKFDGTELKYNGVNHQLIKDDDVLIKYKGDVPLLDNLECVKDRVLVELLKYDKKTASGLILSTGEKEATVDVGKVIKVGPGKLDRNGVLVPIVVEVGNNVKLSKYGGVDVKIAGKDYLVVRANDVLAIW